eukprot:m51a1_g12255 putative calpain family cysteine protease (841) ;mRNA; r:164287-169163
MDKIIARCRRERTPFVDPDFPPRQSSIGPRPMDAVWLRASEFVGEKPKLYFEGIAPDDIEQGALGDCYFLSALSVLAEKPARIKRLFRHHVSNDVGAYLVVLHPDGERKEVIVDDLFPCCPQTRKPLFSRNKGPELWVILLEKAYAKLHGSYQAIEAGSPAKALVDITGAPCRILRVKETPRDALWQAIRDSDVQDHVMCCSVPDVPNRDLKAEVGLVEGHAYALINARQPSWPVEWKGAWSDKDKNRWNPGLKSELGWRDADDGQFWMCLEDFVRFFETVVLLSYNDDWHTSSQRLRLTSNQALVTLDAEHESQVYVTIHQSLERAVGSRMCVLDPSPPHKPYGGTAEAFTVTPICCTNCVKVPRGSHVVMIEVYGQHVAKLPVDVTVSTYSSRTVHLKPYAPKNRAEAPQNFCLPEFGAKYGACNGDDNDVERWFSEEDDPARVIDVESLRDRGLIRCFFVAEKPTNSEYVGCYAATLLPVWTREFIFPGHELVFCASRAFATQLSPHDPITWLGALGDCCFLSALSVLAEKPARIKRLFRHHVSNDVGAYLVVLHPDGERKEVIGSELWVILLEKAYAKLHGSYQAIEAVLRVKETPRDSLWQAICQSESQDHVMCCSVPDVPNRDLTAEVGLVEGHAYALINARKPRQRWKPEVKSELGWRDADDGQFWMCLEDFVRFFETVVLLSYNDDWHTSSQRLTLTAFLHAEHESQVYVTLHQGSKAAVGCRICVLDQMPPHKPYGGTSEAFTLTPICCTSCLKVPKGSHVVMIEVYSQHVAKLPVDVTVSTYSSRTVHLRPYAPQQSTAAAPQNFCLPEFAAKYGACSACNSPLSGTTAH